MPTFDVTITRRYVREFDYKEIEADTEDDAIAEVYDAILSDGTTDYEVMGEDIEVTKTSEEGDGDDGI